MATIKSYTDISQSKTLSKILPIESADMTYCAITEGMREKMTIKNWEVNVGLDIAIKENLFSYRNGYIFPCWSLAALLNILPNYEINNFGDGIQLGVNKEAFATEGDETLLDLVVNMIIHLHKLKKL